MQSWLAALLVFNNFIDSSGTIILFWCTIVLRRDPESVLPAQAILFQKQRFILFTPPINDAPQKQQLAGQVVEQHILALGCEFDKTNSFTTLNEHLYKAYKDQKPYTIIITDLSRENESCNLKNTLPNILHPQFTIALTSQSHDLATDDYDAIIPPPIKRSLFYEQLARCMGHKIADEDINDTSQSQQELTEKREKLRILLVDDNVINIKVGSKMLSKLGVSCATASNGVEALAALGAAHYDLVFMDIQMPVMDGYETTKQIRSRNTTTINPKIIIIAMTAHALKSDKDRCLAAGMNDFLTKPVKLEALNEVLTHSREKLHKRCPGACRRFRKSIERACLGLHLPRQLRFLLLNNFLRERWYSEL